jgi:hypothetical protein
LGKPAKKRESQGGGFFRAWGRSLDNKTYCSGRENLTVLRGYLNGQNSTKEFASHVRIRDVKIRLPQNAVRFLINVRKTKHNLRSFATGLTRNREFQHKAHVSGTRHSARLGVLLVRALRGA